MFQEGESVLQRVTDRRGASPEPHHGHTTKASRLPPSRPSLQPTKGLAVARPTPTSKKNMLRHARRVPGRVPVGSVRHHAEPPSPPSTADTPFALRSASASTYFADLVNFTLWEREREVSEAPGGFLLRCGVPSAVPGGSKRHRNNPDIHQNGVPFPYAIRSGGPKPSKNRITD